MTFEWTVSTDCCEKLLLSIMHPEDEIFDKLNKCLFELPEYNQKTLRVFLWLAKKRLSSAEKSRWFLNCFKWNSIFLSRLPNKFTTPQIFVKASRRMSWTLHTKLTRYDAHWCSNLGSPVTKSEKKNEIQKTNGQTWILCSQSWKLSWK